MATVDNFMYYLRWIIVAVVLHFIIKTCSSKFSKTRLPPGPMALPIIGHLHLLSERLPKSLEVLASKYGPVMQIIIAGTPIFVVSDADIAKDILKTHDVDFASKYALGFGLSHFDIYDGFSFVNAQYGTCWKFMKKLCMTQLFAGAQLDRFVHIREEETLKFASSLVERSRKGEPCDLGKELPTFANNIICRMAMGKRCAENPGLPLEIRKLSRDMMAFAAKLSFTEVFGPLKRFDLLGNGKRLVSATQEYDRLMEQIIKIYEENEINVSEKEGKDVMDILLETYKDSNAELKLTRNHIKKFFLELFFAGVDTTAATIEFAIIELINNPKILKKLRQEIDSVVESKRLINEFDIPKLPYLQAIVKETLRRHPAGPFLRRQCNTDTKINGYDIKAGTRILINTYAIMRDPNTWNEPDEFLLERFLMHSSITSGPEFKGQDFHFLPFGSGRRACLGASHALIVTQVAIGVLVQCFDWKVKDEDKIDIKMVTGYAGAMALPFRCYPVIRFDPFKA